MSGEVCYGELTVCPTCNNDFTKCVGADKMRTGVERFNAVESEKALDDPVKVKIIIAILVKRLGGNVRIDQDSINDVAYGRLLEGYYEGSYDFSLTYAPKQSSTPN